MSLETETPADDAVDVSPLMQDAMQDAMQEVAAEADAPALDAGDDTAESEAADGEGATAPPVETTPSYEPFTFRAFKQEYEVPGLAFDRRTNAIVAETPQALERVKQMLAQGREWEARGRQELVQLRKENAALREQPVAELEHAKVYLQEFQRLMDMPVEELAQWLMEARTQWPVMQAKAERAYAERLMSQAQAAAAPPEPDVEMVVEQANAGAEGLVQELLQGQPWAHPDIAAEVTEYLQDPRVMDQWVLRAKRDMPEIGVRAGQYVADWDTARAMVDRLLNPYRRAHAQTATVQQRAAQTTKIAQQNAARLAQSAPVKKAPAAPSTKPAAPVKPASRSELMADVWQTWKEVNRPR